MRYFKAGDRHRQDEVSPVPVVIQALWGEGAFEGALAAWWSKGEA